MNLIVTGDVQSGKTTWCSQYSHWLAERGVTVGGILCLEAPDEGGKVGHDALDVRTGRTAVFSRVAARADFPGETVGAYRISRDGLAFARNAILEALEDECDLVFIDEMGHLELAGGGIAEAAGRALVEAPNTTVVIRRALLVPFLERLRAREPALDFAIKHLAVDDSFPLPERRRAQQSATCYH